jgi:hypothetical protein
VGLAKVPALPGSPAAVAGAEESRRREDGKRR